MLVQGNPVMKGGWTRGGLLSNELVFRENEFDYEICPTTYEIKFASLSKQQHLSFKHGQGCAIIQALSWHVQESLLFQWQVKQPQESGWVECAEPGGVGGWGWWLAGWHPWSGKSSGCWTCMVGSEGEIVKLSWEWVSFPSHCK